MTNEKNEKQKEIEKLIGPKKNGKTSLREKR